MAKVYIRRLPGYEEYNKRMTDKAFLKTAGILTTL
jgi:hypothetical protein